MKTLIKDAMVNTLFIYKGKKYEVTSTTLTGRERRVYNHTDKVSELIPAYSEVIIINSLIR